MVAASACNLEIGNRCELDSPEKYRKDRPRENVIHEDSAEFRCSLLSLSQGEHQLMLRAPFHDDRELSRTFCLDDAFAGQ